jgi:hypothetical protein
MPYKASILGKHKITGKLEQWVNTFYAYYREDFPPETAKRPYWMNYADAMTDLFVRYCDRKWYRAAGVNYYADFSAYASVWDGARRDRDVRDIPMYRLLDFMAERLALEEFSGRARRFRRIIISRRPDYARQVIGWDAAIAALVAADKGDEQAEAALDAAVAFYRDSADWGEIAVRLRLLRSHEAGPDLASGLNAVDAVVVTRALAAMDGELRIDPVLWPAMEFGVLLGDIVAAAADETGAAERARHTLAKMSQDTGRSALAAALVRVLGGERGPGLTSQLSSPFDRAVVTKVLDYIGAEWFRSPSG